MTKGESVKLAKVEARIDDMFNGMVTLKEFLITKIDAQEKAISISMLGQKEAIGIAMVASEKAIVKAEIANDLRFSEMDKRINDSIEAINTNIKTLTESKDLNSGAKTGIKDFQSWITWAIMIVGFIITYFVLKGV